MLIGVTGCSGSGKSSFVRFLQKYISLQKSVVFTQDNYYIKRELQPLDDKGICNFDLPESIDLDLYYKDLLTLKQGRSIIQNKYNYNNSSILPEILEIIPAHVIISEGIFIFHQPIFHNQFDLKIFIQSQPEVSFKRRLYRDETERGYGFDDVNYRFYNHVLPSYQMHVEPLKDICDIIIDNTANDLQLLESKAKETVDKYVNSR